MKSSYLSCNYSHLTWRDVQALYRAARYEDGPMPVASYPDGFYVQVPGILSTNALIQEMLASRYTDDLIAVMRHAIALDCTLIRFDRNGPVLPGYRTHDH